MPPLGLLIGGVNFTDLKWVMKAAEYGADGKETAAAVTLNYGNFLQATFDFLIIAFSIFLFIKLITKLTQKKAEAPYTNLGVESLEGADMITFLAPAWICLRAVSSVKKKPVDSTCLLYTSRCV